MLQTNTAHTPPSVNLAMDKIDRMWATISDNLKGKRCVRIVAGDMNAELTECNDKDDAAADQEVPQLSRRAEDEGDEPRGAANASQTTARDHARRRSQQHGAREQTRLTWAHLPGMKVRPCNAYAQ